MVPKSWLLISSFVFLTACLNESTAAQAQNGLPTTIPKLSGYDDETQQTMELACIGEKSNGPVPYGACLDQQIASLKNSSGIPNLSGYDDETQQSMELACIGEKSNGPVPYGTCLNRQIASMKSHSDTPNLTSNDRETRQNMEPAPSAKKRNRLAAYGVRLNQQVASLKSPFNNPSSNNHDSQMQLYILLLLVVLWILLIHLAPIIWVLISGRSHGGAKFGWFLVTVFFSWLGLAAFLIFTQASKDQELMSDGEVQKYKRWS